MPQEVELKFDIESDSVALACEVGVLSSEPSEARDHESLYFDTPDGALRKAGYSLRVRRSGNRCIQTIKRRNGGSVGLFVRSEWESDVPGFDIARTSLRTSALKRVLRDAAGDALAPLIRTQFRRTQWLIERGNSRIEVALDEGLVRSGDREAPICELELELLEGKAGTLFRLAEEIGTVLPLRLGVLSKGERGFALAEGKLGTAAKAEPVRVTPTMKLGEAFRIVANNCLRHFRLNEIALMAGADGEALHQSRVALRRLRSAMTLFRPVLAGNDYEQLRRELRWFTRQFGEARNLDVLVERRGRDATPELQQRRQAAHAHVQTVLRTARTRDLMLKLALWIEGGAWRFRRRAEGEMLPFAQRQLDRLWIKVARRGRELDQLDPEARHRLRIEIKKMRYAAEFLSGLHARKPVSRRRDAFLAALRVLQDRLGELNDLRLHAPALTVEEEAAALAASLRAFARGEAAAGYWREA